MSIDRSRVACLAGAFAFGFGLWASAPWLVGTREPWDAEIPFYYTGVMLFGGAALCVAFPRDSAAAFGGIWAGQLIASLVLPGHDRTWAYLGVVTTGIGSLIGLGGYLAGSLLRVLLTKDPVELADAGAASARMFPAWMRYARLAVVRLCWLPIVLRAAAGGIRHVAGLGWSGIGAEFILLYVSIGLSAALAFTGAALLARTRRRSEFDRALAICTLIAGSVLLLALAL
jgi:hypothetical protein